MEMRSNLYSRAKKSNLERPTIHNKIIKTNSITSNKQSSSPVNESHKTEPPLILPKITPKNSVKQTVKNVPNSRLYNPNNTTNISKQKKQIKIQPYKKNIKNKSYKSFLKENYIYPIVYFLDPVSLCNFMLTCKLFYKCANTCDEIWYHYYLTKFQGDKSNIIPYESHRSHWKQYLISTNQSIYERNYKNLKTKYLTKYKKNIYQAKKDHYFLSNNLYNHLKPVYSIQINNSIYKVKHILSNKILSHINFYTNFDEEYQDMNKITKLKLFFSDKNLGIYNRVIAEYNIKQIKFNCTENEGLSSKICKVYYYNELIISTFEKNYIFFVNISLPICKICEKVFDFIKGIHDFNLNYACDSDSKFGLYDYSLLINLKSWNKIYYSVSVTTCDLREEKENGYELYYINNSTISTSSKIKFDIKTICMKDFIENFLIFDIVLLSYNGDHVLCESKPIVIKEDKDSVDYDEYGSQHFIAGFIDKNYSMKCKFNFNSEINYYALVYLELRFDRKFIEKIFVKY